MAGFAVRLVQIAVVQPEAVFHQPRLLPGHNRVTPITALAGLAGVDLRLLVAVGADAHPVGKSRAGVTRLATGFCVGAAEGRGIAGL